MKQIIEKHSDGSIKNKYYKNDNGKWHGLYISYWSDEELAYKTNFINGNEYGLETYYTIKNKITEQIYYL